MKVCAFIRIDSLVASIERKCNKRPRTDSVRRSSEINLLKIAFPSTGVQSGEGEFKPKT